MAEQEGKSPQIKISEGEVKKVAALARLNLTPDEVSTFPHQLSDILGHIGKLNRLATDGVDITSSNSEEGVLMREDKLRQPFFSGDLLSNAPQREGTFLKVPKVIE
ncbi:MAG: Asp-tRNA(Asn)/Glu-tRNA(Gln) amidotransferase subunit GatC [Nitrospinota bacterium]|nr:Asp-tRNA(Asn)/Glu-tRNA(Gln) amidotransferase subunit GatC [Nitrospinota bacterium]